MHGYNGCKIRALMKHRITPLLVLAALTCAFGAAQAEKADRSKPMNIEADALRHDEVKQTSVFSGRVVMTKGSIVLRGARLDVRQDADGYQSGIVTAEAGKRAFFRQKRDTLPGAPEEFIEGEGEVIEYDGRTDNVRFITRAELRRYRGGALSDAGKRRPRLRLTAKLVVAACARCWRRRSLLRVRRRLQPRPLAQRCAPAILWVVAASE